MNVNINSSEVPLQHQLLRARTCWRSTKNGSQEIKSDLQAMDIALTKKSWNRSSNAAIRFKDESRQSGHHKKDFALLTENFSLFSYNATNDQMVSRDVQRFYQFGVHNKVYLLYRDSCTRYCLGNIVNTAVRARSTGARCVVGFAAHPPYSL